MRLYIVWYNYNVSIQNIIFDNIFNTQGCYLYLQSSLCLSFYLNSTRDVFYVRRKVDLMKTAKVNAFIMHIFGKIELLSIHAN